MHLQDPDTQEGLGRRFRWICVVAGFGMLFFSIREIWRGGLQTWAWVDDAYFSAGAFWLATDPLSRKSGRPTLWHQRIFWLLFMGLIGASTWHEQGRQYGLAMIAVGVVGATQQETGPWSMSLRKPLGLLCAAVFAVFIAVSVWQSGEWGTMCSVAVALFLLAYQPEGRRSLKENLWRPASFFWAVSGLAALAEFWMHPSFGHFLVLPGILILWFGNLLFHLSSPRAIEHGLLNPQS
jgi:hypothetical protein